MHARAHDMPTHKANARAQVIEEHKGVASNNLTFPTSDSIPVGGSYLKQVTHPAPDPSRPSPIRVTEPRAGLGGRQTGGGGAI